MAQKITVFDFDGTLTRRDSFMAFARFALPGWKYAAAVAKSAPALVAWKLGRKSASEAKEVLFGNLFGGMTYADFRRKGVEFAREIDRMLRNDIVVELEQAVKRGEHVVIVTASVEEWVRPWAVRCGVMDVIATKPELRKPQGGAVVADANGQSLPQSVAGSVLTGRFATPNCKGAEKLRRLREAFPGLADSSAVIARAWGNLPDDKPLLDASNDPHAV